MKIYLQLIIVILFSSCREYNLRKDVKSIIGNEMIFPSYMQATINGCDTVLPYHLNSKNKLVVFYDSTECSSCRIKAIHEWNDIVGKAIGLKEKFNLIIIFSPKTNDVNFIKELLKHSRFNYPVYIDINRCFAEQNAKIISNKICNVMLLDETNKIILIGNPIRNERILNLFQETIISQI